MVANHSGCLDGCGIHHSIACVIWVDLDGYEIHSNLGELEINSNSSIQT